MSRIPRWSAPASFNHYGVFKLFLAVFMFNVIVNTNAVENPGECVTNPDPNIDYFPVKVYPVRNDTSGWNVVYSNTYKVLTNQHVSATYILWQCGTDKPVLTEEYPNAKYFEIPITSVGITSTTQITYLEMLGERESINAIIDDWGSTSPAVSSPCLLQQMQDGIVMDVNTTSYVDENLDLVLSMGFGFAGAENEVSITEYNVKDPVEIAEWLKLYSLFFNKEKLAVDHMMDVAERYACHAEYVDDQTKNVTKPKAMWAYESWGNWYVGSLDTYYVKLIEAAGGEYLYIPPGTVNNYGAVTVETIIEAAAEADVWMYASDNWDTMLYV
jgi:iron complex transport system substrate-binding protein